jgi:hypothetical protein
MKKDVNISPAATYDPKEDLLKELSDTIQALDTENTLLKDKIAIGQWDTSDIEKIDAEETIAGLREQIRLLEIQNKSLVKGRNWYQNQTAETMGSRNYWEKQAKKLQKIIDQGGQNV